VVRGVAAFFRGGDFPPAVFRGLRGFDLFAAVLRRVEGLASDLLAFDLARTLERFGFRAGLRRSAVRFAPRLDEVRIIDASRPAPSYRFRRRILRKPRGNAKR
jgi:hypothetical protein